jgi:hypothetical protein
VTFLKRSAARLERPKARVNPYDAAGYALAAREVDTRTLQAFMGHRQIANTVVYTAVADKRIATKQMRVQFRAANCSD